MIARWWFLLWLSVCSCSWHSLQAQDWTRFRGPNGSGESETSFPASWSATDYDWIVDLPGVAHSSPVIWGERLFVQSAEKDGTQWILCLETKTGKEIWSKQFASAPYPIHNRNSFASSSPVVDESTVYFAFATPDRISLFAFSHDGNLKWNHDDLGPFASQHGFGTSPVLFGDLLVLSNLQMPTDGDTTKSSVMAFHKSTGKLAWKTPRTSGKASYSVPCLRTLPSGDELVLCSTTHGMFGLDLKTGKQNWSTEDVFSTRTVSSPLFVGDLVFGSTGSGGGGNYVVAIDLQTKKVKYKVKRQAPYVPTPVARGDLVFLWSDKGIVQCIDATSGESHGVERVGGNYSGSPIRAGDKVFCIAEDGTIVAVAAEKEFKLLGKTALNEDSRSTPAIADGRMFLRTYSQLFCIAKTP